MNERALVLVLDEPRLEAVRERFHPDALLEQVEPELWRAAERLEFGRSPGEL